MASDKNYATIDDLSNLLLVDVDSTFKAQVEKWISAAEIYAEGFTGFTTVSGFWNEAITGELLESRVDGDGNLVIYPRKRPVNSVSKIELWKGSDSMTLSLTDGANTRYIIPAQNNCIIYPNHELTISSSSYSINNFYNIKYSRWYTKVDYIAGYSTIPKDITMAVTLIASDYFMRHANKEGLVSMTQGRISKRWSERKDGKSDLVVQAEDILLGYKIASGYF